MNTKSITTLELNKILDMLSDQASSLPGKVMCSSLRPSSDIKEVEMWQQHTDDALRHVLRNGSVSFDGVSDIGESLKRLEIGGSLNTSELLKISALLGAAKKVKSYLKHEDDAMQDSLIGYADSIEPLTPLYNDITRCIISESEIADDASPELRHIRRKIKNSNDLIRERLSSYLTSKAAATVLQDNIITLRDGRYCLPVRTDHKNEVKGIVHDQSSSGSTVFIEPAAVVELNNTLRELALEETGEIEKILASLSEQCSEFSRELTTDMKVLTKLDFIFACAKLAKNMKASRPVLNTENKILIKQGRHPLIDPVKVVPIDLNIGFDFSLLIITGPNTGGKTVTLKTVGLFTLMAQCGLQIPAENGSQIGIFEEVYADIGDEQSIEQSLSTFSSHMVNTINILEKADSRCLVLFDELGAGTDPVEGAALGVSILSFLKNMGVTTMASTHYSELKLFALKTPGVENASCEFDVKTLRPTYKLLVGIPGKSNAFAISERLGLPEYIIEDAKSRIDSEQTRFEDVIAQLDESRREMEKKKEEASLYQSQISSLKKDYILKTKRLEEQKDRILNEAREEALSILKEAKETADREIRSINKYGKSSGASKMEESRRKLNDAIKKNQTQKNIGAQTSHKEYKPSDFSLGMEVMVLSMNLRGTVSSLPDKDGNLSVKMGIFNSKVNIKDLEIIDEKSSKQEVSKKGRSNMSGMDKSLNISTELNLIGKTVDEALPELDKYLDDAYMAKLEQVYIIHGNGTGRLRSAIHRHLKSVRYIDSFRMGGQGEGGYGATVVKFKK